MILALGDAGKVCAPGMVAPSYGCGSDAVFPDLAHDEVFSPGGVTKIE